MFKPLIALIVLAAATGTHAAQVYKCTDADGKLTYSQQPCEADTEAEVVEVENKTSGIDVVAEGDFSKIEEENEERSRVRRLDKRIATHQHNIQVLERERDAKIQALRDGQGTARNNAAGAAYHGSLATEIQTVTQEYRARIETEQDAINRLREQY